MVRCTDAPIRVVLKLKLLEADNEQGKEYSLGTQSSNTLNASRSKSVGDSIGDSMLLAHAVFVQHP